MTQQQWDWIGYGVWALIIWMTLKQYRQTRRYVKGSGLSLLLGDWLLFAPLPWIVWRMAERGTWEQAGWVLLLGVGLALPYIATTSATARPPGSRTRAEGRIRRKDIALPAFLLVTDGRYIIKGV